MSDVQLYSEEIKAKALEGNIQAISLLTGINRQTLYRWKRRGENITLDEVKKLLIRKKDWAEIWGPSRGRPIVIQTQKHFAGLIPRKEKMKSKKDLTIAIADLIEAIAVVQKNQTMSENHVVSLKFILPKLIDMIPPDLRSEFLTPLYPTKTGKNG